MKRIFCAIGAFLVGVFGMASCQSTGEVDWDAVGFELELAALDIADAAELTTDEELAANLVKLAEMLTVASQSTDAADGRLGSIRVALSLADALVAELPADDTNETRLLLFVARALLRRAEAYATSAS